MIVLQILLTIWITCGIFNIIVMAPVLFSKKVHEVVSEEIERRYPNQKTVSRLELFAIGIIAAPILSYDVLFGDNK